MQTRTSVRYHVHVKSMSLEIVILEAAATGNERAVAAWLDEGGGVDFGGLRLLGIIVGVR